MKRWRVLKAMSGKIYIEMKRYFFNTLSGVITMYIIFLLLFFGVRSFGGGAIEAGETLEGLIVGYTVWLFAIVAYQDLAWTISMEAEIGTLEQLYLTPTGFAWVNASIMAVRFVWNVIMVGGILALMMATSGKWLRVDLVSVLPLTLVTVAAAYGFGFMMGGLALVFKRIQNTFQILQFIFVGFIIIPIDQFPWVKYTPLALGNSLIRAVMVDGARLWQLPAGDVLLATTVGLGYLLLGLAAFTYCVRIARDRGLMGHY